jgi:flagellar hook-length control protein FliK
MASLQTNALLSSPNAANAAMKASTQTANTQTGAGDKDDFATMLNGATAPGKNSPAPKTAAAGSKSQAPTAHATAKRDVKTDVKTAGKKTEDKPDRKHAAKDDDTTATKTAAAAPAVTAKAQQSVPDPDSDQDAAPDAGANIAADTGTNTSTQTATNQNNTDPSVQTPPQTPQDPSQQPVQQPAAPTDAMAQAQQMMAAAAPVMNIPAAQTSAAPANDNNNSVANVGAAGAKGARSQAPRAPAPAAPVPASTGTASTDTANAAPNAASDGPAAVTKTATGNTPDFLKATGHQDSKSQTDAKTDAAPATNSTQSADATQVAAAPAPQPSQPATPAPGTIAAVAAPPVGGQTGVAANTGPAANANVAANVHVAPQGPAPNVNSLAVEIAARSQSGSKQFQIRLDPPELGHVEVRLSIDASGKAEAHMSADQQQTLDLLQKNSPALTSALRDAGLDVSQSGLNFSLRGQDRQSGGDNNGGAQARTPGHSLAATKTIDAVQSANAYLSSAGDARLDIHV